ncbi:MAG: hypothetical protein N2Z21_08195 [Candidatus Sumerlaeaceae bacterium]|nr:hypothetical protein [Candidatus Sumerlaeaceae bacterium]
MAKDKPKQQTQAELALQDAQALLEIWLRIKAFFVKAASEEEITPEDERNFLDLKSEVQRLQRLLKNKMVAGLSFGEQRMQDLLKQSISIKHLRELPKMDRQLLVNSWHFVFVHLARAVGALQFIVEGYRPSAQAAKTGGGPNISELKGGAAGEGKGKKKERAPIGKYILVIVLLGVAIFVVGKRLQWF